MATKANVRPYICSVDGCHRQGLTRGWCQLHYRRVRRNGTLNRPPKPTSCSVQGCNKKYSCRGYCHLHYERVLHHGTTELLPKPRKYAEELLAEFTSPSELGRHLSVSRQRAHQMLDRKAFNARMRLTHAMERGILVKPSICMIHGKPSDDLEAHHVNYNYPLAVIWCCPPCHSRVHPHHPGSRNGQGQVVEQHGNGKGEQR